MTIHKTAVVGGIAAAGIIAAFSATGTASASCASLNGNHIGDGCEGVNGGLALGLGPKAAAVANGPGTVAIAVGNAGANKFYPDTVMGPQAYATGSQSVALALGDGSNAGTLGRHNLAVVLGKGSNAYSYGGNSGLQPYEGNRNVSITVGDGKEAGAVGNHRFALGKKQDN